MSFSVALRRLAASTRSSSSNHAILRSFSSYNNPPTPSPGSGQYYQASPQGYNNSRPQTLRSNPVYSVVGEDCLLSFKMIPPYFKVLSNQAVVLDGSKKGRIMLEFAPRDENGVVERMDKDKIFRFALSAEEVGFLLNQLPDNEVMFVRKPPKDAMADADAVGETGKEPLKICRITPGEAGTITFLVDFEIDNVGGQTVAGGAQGPMSVTIQLGEAEVVRRIMDDSITYLSGWKTMCDIQDEAIKAVLANGPSDPRRGY